MTACPVCGGVATREFLTRTQVPVHQNLITRTVEAARTIRRGTLEMAVCETCGFAFNRAFDETLLEYGDDYDNTQVHSPSFKSYTDGLVERLVGLGVRDARVVEVGCGKGHFIQKLVESAPNTVGWGFDPSYVGPEDMLQGRLNFRREFYGPGCDAVLADVVVCRQVIEHGTTPMVLLEAVRAALARSPDARVFFETPSLDWILENVVVWDLFYEHCSLFTPGSLRTAFERAGFEVSEIATTFGGQYLWAEARVSSRPPTVEFRPGKTPELARRFAREEARLVEQLKRSLVGAPSTAIWGAGAKGVTFANLADPTCTLVDCIVDLNPHKQGRFMPGTGHAIVAPEALMERGVKRAILMNPNYRDENQRLLSELGLDIALDDPFT
jgi:2-polyprenyl-3-methyl-5-hydroxy-6-metoxy-1,4-benzoquinol methylase